MLTFILGLICSILALTAIGLQRTYNALPLKELKRRARAGDPLGQLLYRAVSYGVSLRGLLWLLVGGFGAAAFVFFAQAANGILAFILVLGVMWLGFLWFSADGLNRFGTMLARLCTPALAWILHYLHTPLERIGLFVRRFRHVHVHTGLYEKEDLVLLLEQQRNQADNRIGSGEITLLQHALRFGDKLVGDIQTPRRVVQGVSLHETSGPILMNTLHKSGHSRFPVYGDSSERVEGMLYLRDLVGGKQSGEVSKLMRRDINYMHENFSLYQALQAFLRTKRQMFIVVNSFEEYTGIITLEDVLEQMIGRPIVDEFDQYDDLRAVAASAAKAEHNQHQKDHAEPIAEKEKSTSEKDSNNQSKEP